MNRLNALMISASALAVSALPAFADDGAAASTSSLDFTLFGTAVDFTKTAAVLGPVLVAWIGYKMFINSGLDVGSIISRRK